VGHRTALLQATEEPKTPELEAEPDGPERFEESVADSHPPCPEGALRRQLGDKLSPASIAVNFWK
jgi:hypothetical protein